MRCSIRDTFGHPFDTPLLITTFARDSLPLSLHSLTLHSTIPYFILKKKKEKVISPAIVHSEISQSDLQRKIYAGA